MSNTNIIKELPEHLQSTVIKLLCEYLVMLEHLQCSEDIYLHVVSHSIDHLRELPNTSVVTSSKPIEGIDGSIECIIFNLLKEYKFLLNTSKENNDSLSFRDKINLNVLDKTLNHLNTFPINIFTSAPNKEVVNYECIVNNHLKDLYEAMLTHLSNDLSNTDLMDKIKAFKLLHPEVVNSFHKVVDTSGSIK